MAITTSTRFDGSTGQKITFWGDDTDALTRAQMTASHSVIEEMGATFRQDVIGNRPAAGTTTTNGSFFYDTGNDRLFYSDGTEWIEFALAGKTTSADLTLDDGTDFNLGAGSNIVLDTATGTKIGTATGQKLGFFNATPVVRPANTNSNRSVLSTLGLVASGGDTRLDVISGTSAPSSPTAGQLFYDTGQDKLEVYDGAAWVGVVPTGTIQAFYGTTAPSGWLFCDGSSIAAGYTDLIALVGANTPDLRDKSLVGRSTTGTAFGTTGDDALDASVEILLVPDTTSYTPQAGDVYANVIDNSAGTVTNLSNVPPSGTVNWIIKT